MTNVQVFHAQWVLDSASAGCAVSIAPYVLDGMSSCILTPAPVFYSRHLELYDASLHTDLRIQCVNEIINTPVQPPMQTRPAKRARSDNDEPLSALRPHKRLRVAEKESMGKIAGQTIDTQQDTLTSKGGNTMSSNNHATTPDHRRSGRPHQIDLRVLACPSRRNLFKLRKKQTTMHERPNLHHSRRPLYALPSVVVRTPLTSAYSHVLSVSAHSASTLFGGLYSTTLPAAASVSDVLRRLHSVSTTKAALFVPRYQHVGKEFRCFRACN